MKKWLSVLLALLLMLCVSFAALAEDARKTEYIGGVVMRTMPKGQTVSEGAYINVGFAECDAPYLLLGHMTSWLLGIEGGVQPYDISLVLWRRALDATDHYYWYYDSLDLGNKQAFTYVYKEAGEYFWEVTVQDSVGQTLVFQTRPMKTAGEKEETDVTTAAGKVNQIIAQEIRPGMSEYHRALVLHDWLIYNANYDYTYTWYAPEGVLLHGTGVCDSYARAYEMLCTAAGLEVICVTGTANGGAHGWNLVKVDGKWLHVDCTWDDPGMGGKEHHGYFLVTDEVMRKDHQWNLKEDNGMKVPEANESDFEGTNTTGADFTFKTMDDCTAGIKAMMADGNYNWYIVAQYTGSANIYDVYNEFNAWAKNTLPGVLGNQGRWRTWSAQGDRFMLEVRWNAPTEYVRFNEEKVLVCANETKQIYAADFYPAADFFTCESSDPSIVKAALTFDTTKGLILSLTGVSGGKASVTITSRDGQTDTVEVTVMAPYAPEFKLEVEPLSQGVHLVWQSIPGMTEYHVHAMSAINGVEECLAVVEEHECDLTNDLLPSSGRYEVWVVGRRVVGGQVVNEYCGEHFSRGEHSPVTDPAVQPTCTQVGLTEGSHCSVCNAVIKAQEVIPALGHEEVTGKGTPATHVTTGMTASVSCSRCNAVLEKAEVIPVVQTAVFSVPSHIQVIKADAFASCRFACVVINSGCRSIGARAFADNAALRFVEIPASVTSIDASAFTGCSADLIIVTTAGSAAEAFARQQGLTCILR